MKKIVLKNEEVLEIIDLLKNSDKSYEYIACKYNVKKPHITDINRGKRYVELTSNLDLPIRKVAVRSPKKDMIEKNLSDREILEIIEILKENKVKFEDIAKQYNVNRQIIGRINSGDFNHSFLKDITFPIRVKHIRSSEGDYSIKLSDDDVLKIVKLLKENKLTFSQIADKFNVSVWTINRINTGHRCLELLKDESFPIRKEAVKNSTVKLTDNKVVEIIKLLQNSNESLKAIGSKYGIDSTSVGKINNGKSWTNVTSIYVEEYPIRKK